MNKSIRILILALFMIGLVTGVSAIVDDSYTKILLHFDSPDSWDTNIYDESGKVWTAQSSAHVTTANQKFSTGGLELVAVLSDYIWAPDSTDYDILNDDYTIDTWVNVTVNPAVGATWAIFSDYDGSDGYYLAYGNSAGTYFLTYYTYKGTVAMESLTTTSAAPILSTGTWHHIAVVQESSTAMKMYVDGNFVDTDTRVTTYDPSTASFALGQVAAGSFANMTIDEFRLSKGVGRWAGNFTLPTKEYAPNNGYEYRLPGSYTWTAPSGVSYVFLNMAGGGGSGKSTGYLTTFPLFGYGGSAGQYGNYTMVPVTAGTAYPITVGYGGAQSAASSPSNAGTGSSALGYTKSGGAGGLQGGMTIQAGGVGESTNYLSTLQYSKDGGWVMGYSGGVGGTGYGAGGGGAANNGTATATDTYGGAGSPGYVAIYDMNMSGTNQPYYSALPLSSGVGSIITFTDESIINDIGNLTYLWDFGDSSTSSTKGTVTHVYNTYGVYSVNLTLTSDSGTNYNYKQNYITITNVPITAWYTQKLVRLKIVDAFGNDLQGANISISYISNTLPSQDPTWLTTAFGISQAVATQMVDGSVAMYGFSDSDGGVSFMMFPAIQYGVTITNASAGLSKYVTLYPQDNDYVIYCPLSTQAEPTSRITHLYNTSLYVTEPNATHIMWNIYYQDTSGYTTILNWNVTCVNNGTVMYTKTWAPFTPTQIAIDNYTFPVVPAGYEYQAMFRARRDLP